MDPQLPQIDSTRDRLRQAETQARMSMDAVKSGDIDVSTARSIIESARGALEALLLWHRFDPSGATFADLIRRAENLAAPIATPARVLASMEMVATRETLSGPDHELVRSGAFTLRNLVETVSAHLPEIVRPVASVHHPA